jgi:hypothetical protein
VPFRLACLQVAGAESGGVVGHALETTAGSWLLLGVGISIGGAPDGWGLASNRTDISVAVVAMTAIAARTAIKGLWCWIAFLNLWLSGAKNFGRINLP